MAKVKRLKIQNFRGIVNLEWFPNLGINCLVGPGDSGKSTILDAIDWCLGARRSLPVTDADFNNLAVENPIIIEVTLGDLNDDLKNLEKYGLYLGGMSEAGDVEDEPGENLETVLEIRLSIRDDLEPNWELISDRAEQQGLSRNLAWSDRVNIAPTRIGAFASHHLGWQKGSILNLISDERANTSAQLAQAAREARESFGATAEEQLSATLDMVDGVSSDLGVPIAGNATALLDAHSVNISGGTIALHDGNGVPLRKLGLGSSRLLVAGLQNKIAQSASIALVDEVEIGLEPHRIAKFLNALGSKNKDDKLQVFMTTHSPVVLRELNGSQLHVIRTNGEHTIKFAGCQDSIQGTLRSAPEAFLGSRVLVCEGATEVGLIRGIDLYRSDKNLHTFVASGGVTVDAGGAPKLYRNALPFLRLGYKTAVLRDDDQKPNTSDEENFTNQNGTLFKWEDGCAFEDELFDCLSTEAVIQLWEFAKSTHGESTVEAHLTSANNSSVDFDNWFEDIASNNAKRKILANAAKTGSWFKRISIMESAAREIVAPDLPNAKREFRDLIDGIYVWAGVADE